MGDESPWLTKSQIMVALGRSSRTIDLWVRAGRIERMQDGSHAFFRLATPGNSVTQSHTDAASPELLTILSEMRDELRALRSEVAALRALPSAELPVVTPSDTVTEVDRPPGNEVLPVRNAVKRRGWLARFLYGPT